MMYQETANQLLEEIADLKAEVERLRAQVAHLIEMVEANLE